MSTRACIAKASGQDSWQGVYSHYDGYPSGIGREIWRIIHWSYFKKSENGPQRMTIDDYRDALEKFCKTYIAEHPGGWSSFEAGVCYCHDPLFKKRDGALSGRITSDDPDPLFIEWVYVLDPETISMTIYSHIEVSTEEPVRRNPLNLGDGQWDYGHCICRHVRICWIDLMGEEPEWKDIEQDASRIVKQEKQVMAEQF